MGSAHVAGPEPGLEWRWLWTRSHQETLLCSIRGRGPKDWSLYLPEPHLFNHKMKQTHLLHIQIL